MYATVTDASGRLVADPTRNQFQIDDNGKRQELTLFANDVQPIADELHHQYSLGFTPARLDGKMHSLTLRLGKEGLTARAQKSYPATTPR